MNWCGHMGWGWGGGFMMVLWTVLIAAAVYWLIRSALATSRNALPSESALDILKKRFARGEISREEFEQRKKDLL